MAATLESVLSHILPFSKIKHRHFFGHPRYFYLCLQGPKGNGNRERIWKEDLYLMALRLPCIFFSSLFLFNKISRIKESKEKKKKKKYRMEGALVSTFFPVSKLSEPKNGLLSFSETGLEMSFSNHKMKKVSLVFMYLQQSSPISS